LEPPLEVIVSLDREVYRIGETLVATVRLENTGRHPLDVPRFDHQTLKFLCGSKDMDVRLRREPVHSRLVAPEPRRIEPGEGIVRRFVFTRLTAEAGEYILLVSFKGAALRGEWIQLWVYGKPATFRVTEPVALKRDPSNGLILKAQAVELAKRGAGGKVKAARGVLVPLGKTGLYTWVVMLRVEESKGGERTDWVQVNPYTGQVKPLELKDAKGALKSGGRGGASTVPLSRDGPGRRRDR